MHDSQQCSPYNQLYWAEMTVEAASASCRFVSSYFSLCSHCTIWITYDTRHLSHFIHLLWITNHASTAIRIFDNQAAFFFSRIAGWEAGQALYIDRDGVTLDMGDDSFLGKGNKSFRTH